MIAKTFCTTREAAKLLGISVRTTQQWDENGLLSAWKTTGGHRRVSRDSVAQLLHKEETQQPVAQSPIRDINLRVLIVGDNLAQSRRCENQLAQWPIPPQVIVCNSGTEALVWIGRNVPDLLIADFSGQEAAGLTMLSTLKSMPELAGLAIIVIGPSDIEETIRQATTPENITVLTKPLAQADLLAVAYKVWARKLAEIIGDFS